MRRGIRAGNPIRSLFLLSLVIYLGTSVAHASPQGPSGLVVIANFNMAVDPGSAAFMKRVANYAASQNAVAIVIEMNTPGGLLNDMVSIISSITDANQSGIPTYTYVVQNGLAASAGSYIAMATNEILMGPGSAIGPSTPIVVGGTELEQNHTQGAMLKLMVSLAQRWGRNSTAAYGMVQGDQAYSADEAVDYHLAEGFAGSLDEAIFKLGLSGRQQVVIGMSLYEQFISSLSDPTLDGILILLGVVAIVLDIYHPTVLLTIIGAVAMIAGLIGAEVVSASLLGFLIIAIAGVLVIIELKLGHGLAMMAGVILGAVGILYLSQGMAYSPSPITSYTDIELEFVAVVGVVAGLYFRWVIGPIRRRAKITGPEALLGQIGKAVTDLKPEGEVRVGGIIWRAQSVSGEIAKGDTVRVKSIDGLVVVVERAQT
jgi:membrane-bound serine protease (ClpP class)